MVGSHSKFGPGETDPAGGFGHSYWHDSGLHVYSGPGLGPPQSAGHSQVHVATSHSKLPSHNPPQSAVHSKSHTAGFVLQTCPGGGSPAPQPGHANSHVLVSHVENCDGAVPGHELQT